MDGFELSQMSNGYADEWRSVSEWLKLSFHSDRENICPYECSGYDEVFEDCSAVNKEILRFTSADNLAKTTTVHYCQTTKEGLKALTDNGVVGLLGLFGTEDAPSTSYSLGKDTSDAVRQGNIVSSDGVAFASLDMVVNGVKKDDLLTELNKLLTRDTIRIMIHEQYFYTDYINYQPDFEEKLETVFSHLRDNGYKSCFFEELI